MEEKTVWELAADAFKDSGIDLYPPGLKDGECKKRYVVLKNDGSNQIGNFSSSQRYYSFLCYVPIEEYTSLEKFKKEVEKIVEEKLYPMLLPTGNESADFFDKDIKAHMSYIMYKNNVKKKYL